MSRSLVSWAFGLAIVGAYLACPRPANAIRIAIPDVYAHPGTIGVVEIIALPEGATVDVVQQYIQVDPRLETLACINSRAPHIPTDIIFSVYNREQLKVPTIIERCWVRVPQEPGVYSFEVIDALVSTPPVGSPAFWLPPESLARGRIIVTEDLPTPTPTPPRPPGPAVCGDGILQEDEQCDDGNTTAGDGCAPNCTVERRLEMHFAPAVCSGGPNDTEACETNDDCPDGACTPTGTAGILQSKNLAFEIGLTGRLALIAGSPRDTATYDADGEQIVYRAGDVPFMVEHRDAVFEPIRIPGLACVCAQVGPRLPGPTRQLVGEGMIACGAEGLDGADYAFEVDRSVPGSVPPVDPDFFGSGPAGSATLATTLSVWAIFDGGTCCRVGVDPGCPNSQAKGDDGIPCTWDDLVVAPAGPVTLTTGAASGTIWNTDGSTERIAEGSRQVCRQDEECPETDEGCFEQASRFTCTAASEACTCRVRCGLTACTTAAEGAPFDCAALAEPGDAPAGAGPALALARIEFDGPTGDAVTTVRLAPHGLSVIPATSTPTQGMPPTWTPTRTATPSPTGSPATPTPFPTSTATRTPTPIRSPCMGSCFEGWVSLISISRVIDSMTGELPTGFCVNADLDGDGTITVDELIQVAARNNRGPCSEAEFLRLEPTPASVACAADCFNEGRPGTVELSWVERNIQHGELSCMNVLHDASQGVGVLDAMAVIQDVLRGCRIVEGSICTDKRRRIGRINDDWPPWVCE